MISSSVFKTDPSKVNASVERMHCGVTVAVLHVALKARVGVTKILGNDIRPPSIRSEGQW